MKLNKIIESRSHPDQNPKESMIVRLQRLEARHPDAFVSFSDNSKLDILRKPGGNEFPGIYAYHIREVIKNIRHHVFDPPEDEKREYGTIVKYALTEIDKAYIHIFEDNDDSVIWSLDNHSIQQKILRRLQSGLTKLGIDPDTILDADDDYDDRAWHEHQKNLVVFHNIIDKACNLKKSKFMQILNAAGIDELGITPDSRLHSSDGYVNVFFDLKKLKLIDTLHNNIQDAPVTDYRNTLMGEVEPTAEQIGKAFWEYKRLHIDAAEKAPIVKRALQQGIIRYLRKNAPEAENNVIDIIEQIFKPGIGSPMWLALEPYFNKYPGAAAFYANQIKIRLPKKLENKCIQLYGTKITNNTKNAWAEYLTNHKMVTQ